jgi:polar amino acid transport system substrate-binding protein
MHEVQLIGPAATVGEARDPASFDKASLTIGAVGGSAEVQDARRRLPNAKIQEFDGPASLAGALLDGRVALAVAAAPLPKALIKMTGANMTVVAEPLSVRGEAFAVRRGDLEFLAYLNTWVQARTYDRWLKERADHWFVTLDWARPLAKPVSQD